MNDSRVQHPHFTDLDILRGIATIGIFIHHISWRCGICNYIFSAFGDCFVAFFFILSGFLSTKSQQESGNADALTIKSVAHHIISKISKLYPMYLLCYILALTMSDSFEYIPTKVLLLNATMLQSWIPYPSLYFSVNSVSWFVSAIMFCHLLLLPVLKLMNKYSKVFWTAAILVYITYFIVIQYIPEEMTLPIIYINPLMEFPAFLFGIISFHIFNKASRYTSHNIGAAQLICWLALIASLALCCHVHPRYVFASYWWLVWGALIIVTAKASMQKSSSCIAAKAMILMSKISYPFFMLHTIVIAGYINLCQHMEFASPVPLTIVITFTASIAASAITNRIINAT